MRYGLSEIPGLTYGILMHRISIAILSFSVLASNAAAGKTSYSCRMSLAETMSNCCCYHEENQESDNLMGDHDSCKLPDCQGKESENNTRIRSHGSCCTVSHDTVEAVKGVFPKTHLDSSVSHLKNLPPGPLMVCEKAPEANGDRLRDKPPQNQGSSLTIPTYILTHALLC